LTRLSSLKASDALVKRSTLNRGIYDGSEHVMPELHEWWLKFQAAAAKVGVPLRVVWGYRGEDVQNALNASGNSQLRFPDSAHNRGLALDIIHMSRAWDGMSASDWLLLGTTGLEVARQCNLPLDWGGNWRADWAASPPRAGWDCAHWELTDYRKFPLSFGPASC
jgi:hypothetical protein